MTSIVLPVGFWKSKFVIDSYERGVFDSDGDDHVTATDLRALLSDAEYYADKLGPDMCSPGLKSSARSTIRKVNALLTKLEEK